MASALSFLGAFGLQESQAAKRTKPPKRVKVRTRAKQPAKRTAPSSPKSTVKPELRPKVTLTSRLKKKRKEPLPKLPVYNQKQIAVRSLVGHTLRYNPALLRLRRLVKVFLRREQQSDPWPDLQVGIQGTNFPLDSFNPTKTAMSGIIYSISQRFPILKRLSLQRKMAQFNTAMTREVVREKSVWVLFRLEQSVIWMSYLRRALVVEGELHQLMGQAAAVARIKYTVGKAPQQHFLEALTGQALIRNRMVMLVSQERIWRHRALQLLGIQGASLLGQAPAIPQAQTPLTIKQAVTRAMSSRGAVRRWKVSVQQAKTLLSLARVRYWPDVTLQLSVRQRFPNPLDQGVPFLSVGIKVPLPTWGNPARYGLVQEAMARHQLARSKIRELHTLFTEQARIALTQIKQFQQQIQIAKRRTIPLAMQTYRSALSSYQVEKVDFLTLLTNLRTLYKEKLKLDQLRARRAIAHTRLTAIAGDVLPPQKPKTKKKKTP